MTASIRVLLLSVTKQRVIVILCCAFLATCTAGQGMLAPTANPTPIATMAVLTPTVTATTTSPALTSGLVVLFAREDDLWRTDLQGQNIERLTEGGLLNWDMEQDQDWRRATLYRPPQVSPDGRYIVQSRTGRDLVLVDLVAAAQTELPEPGAPFVAWSPDSRYFAYTPDSAVTPDSDELYIYDVHTEEASRLLHLEKDEGVGIVSLVWSPDGRTIAFACCFVRPEEDKDRTGQSIGQIQVVELATGQRETVSTIESSIGGGTPPLCWTTAGEVAKKYDIAPTAAVSCSPNRDTLSPDRTLRVTVSPLNSSAPGPRWLAVQQAETREVLWERELEIKASHAAWTADGRYLLFDDRENHSPIWRIAADGSGEPEIVVEDGYLLEVVPQW